MSEIEVQFAGRYMRRQFEKGVGRSIAKLLTEVMTNSDDSYRRLVAAGRRSEKTVQPITVRLDRGKRRFAVIDHAEGLSKTDMESPVGTYGRESGDRHVGARTRSLFGQRLRDGPLTQDSGSVYSTKGG